MSDGILPRTMLIEELAPLVGRSMRVHCTPDDVDIDLVEVTALKDHGNPLRPPFMAVFRSDAMVQLLPGIYTMRSGNFGPAAIYLENMNPPIGGPAGHYYQSVFN